MAIRRLDERPERFCELLKGWAGFRALTGPGALPSYSMKSTSRVELNHGTGEALGLRRA